MRTGAAGTALRPAIRAFVNNLLDDVDVTRIDVGAPPDDRRVVSITMPLRYRTELRFALAGRTAAGQ